MPFSVASLAFRWKALALAILSGVILAGGFLPTSKSIADALESMTEWYWFSTLSFPLLAGLFCLSAPAPKSKEPALLSFADSLKTIPVPFAISAIFGFFHDSPTLFELFRTPSGREAIVWFTIAIPLGEEWLFRGWLQSLAERFAPGIRLTETNPIPVSVWVSALAFSLWHTQNAAVEPSAFVAFQMLYTFFTGLWLAYLRFATGKLLPCVIAHFSLNVASNLW